MKIEIPNGGGNDRGGRGGRGRGRGGGRVLRGAFIAGKHGVGIARAGCQAGVGVERAVLPAAVAAAGIAAGLLLAAGALAADLRGHGGPVRALSITPAGDLAISGSFDQSAIVWSLQIVRALRILRARLLADAQEKAEAAASAERKSQVRTVDRSERIRTYNFPENRLSDHRVNYKSNNLDSVLNGELDDVIQALLDADKAAKLSATN